MKLRYSLFAFALLFGTFQSSAQKKITCTHSFYADRYNSDAKRNALLDSACSQINQGRFKAAYATLNQIVLIDSALTGNADAFIDLQREKVMGYMEESGSSSEELTVTTTTTTTTPDPAPEPEKIAPVAEEIKSPEVKQAPPENITAEADNSKGKGKKAKSKSKKSEAEKPVKEEEKPVVKEQEPEKIAEIKQEETPPPPPEKKEPEVIPETKTGEISTGTSSEVVTEIKTEEDGAERKFSEEEMQQFHNKGLQKVKLLEGYISQIGSNLTSSSIATETTNLAVGLFDGETRTVQVTNKKSNTKPRYKVRNYLERLRMLNYDDVFVEWAEFQYTSDFFKGPDGKYHAYITFRQRFQAMKDNQNVYEDITTKKTEIILEFYKKSENGIETENWDIFLGDISVEHIVG